MGGCDHTALNHANALIVQGGAIATVGGGDLVVTGGIFRHNFAAEGSALASTSPGSLKVSNTSFDDPTGAFAGEAADVQVALHVVHSLQSAR
jgi:hypothetical protein